jgi:hypothetical protein
MVNPVAKKITMRRQTIFGSGGDCFRSCIASIFDMEPIEVPHFFEGCRIGDIWTQQQWDSVLAWASERNYQAVWIDPEDPKDAVFVKMLVDSGLHYVAFVNTICGPHCVVHRRGKFVGDPLGHMQKYGEPFLYVVFEPSGNSPLHDVVPEVEMSNGKA